MDLEELGLDPVEIRTGEYYRTYIVGNVSIAELDDHRIFTEEADAIAEDFVDKLREYPAVNASVDIVTMDRTVGDLLLDNVEAATKEAREHGLEKYAIVSEDVTRYAMKSRVNIDGVDTFVSQDPEEAIDWALEQSRQLSGQG